MENNNLDGIICGCLMTEKSRCRIKVGMYDLQAYIPTFILELMIKDHILQKLCIVGTIYFRGYVFFRDYIFLKPIYSLEIIHLGEGIYSGCQRLID